MHDSLWLQDLELGVNIFGITGLTKVGVISLFWWIYYLGGTTLTSYYWWVWFSSLLAVYIAWIPVSASYIWWLASGSETAQILFFYFSLTSIIGPMLGYFVPIVILILAYNSRKDCKHDGERPAQPEVRLRGIL